MEMHSTLELPGSESVMEELMSAVGAGKKLQKNCCGG